MTDAPPLKLIPKANAEVDADIVEVLEEWLERARAGAYDGLVIVGVLRDGSISNSFSKTNNRNALIAATARVQYRMLQQMDDE